MHQTDMTCSQYAAAAADGDAAAFTSLFERLHEPLVRWFSTRLRAGERHHAEDLASDTWVKASKTLAQYDETRGTFEARLWGIGKHVLIDYYRRNSSRRSFEALTGDMLLYDAPCAGEGPEDAAARTSLAHMLAAEVNSLTAHQRECVVLRFYVGLTLEEVSSVMGRNVNSVKQLQLRAVRTLSRRLPSDSLPHAPIAEKVGTPLIPKGGRA